MINLISKIFHRAGRQNILRTDDLSEKFEFDECILCGRTTSYKKNTPVNERIHYVFGMGQLCIKCGETYKNRNLLYV